MEAFSEGSVLTVFYRANKNKTTYEKENTAFAVSIAEKNGSKIPVGKRVIIMCVEQGQLQFKSF